MGLVGIHLGPDDPKPPGHPVDMHVHRHGWQAQCETQHDCCGLGADARQRPQPRLGIRQGHLFEEHEIVAASEFTHKLQRFLDARHLLLG